MHQSGHSRAHSMQEVQFSSNSAMTPRERGGSSGCASGYCAVTDRRDMVRSVVARPCARPCPGTSTAPPPHRDQLVRRLCADDSQANQFDNRRVEGRHHSVSGHSLANARGHAMTVLVRGGRRS